MSAPSSNRRERRPAEPTLSRTLTNDAKVAASISDVGDGVVGRLVTPTEAGLRLLLEPGATVELRVPKAGRARVISGYFDDPQAMAREATRLDGRHPGIYFTCNPVKPALLARASNRVVEHAELTTNDHDVARRRWLPIDLDPVRPAGICATDSEHQAAIDKAHQVAAFLAGQGWPRPVLVDSGNGAYVLMRVDLPNDEASRELLHRCLEALALRFDDAAVHVDTTMANAARIIRVPGTRNAKGDSTSDRPHRAAQLLEAPDPLHVVSVQQLQALAATLPPPEPASRNGRRRSEEAGTFDLEAFIDKHLEVHHHGPWQQGGYRWILRICPFNSDHTAQEAFVARRPGGAIVAGCHHHSCTWRWPDLRERFDHKPDRSSPRKAKGKARGRTTAGRGGDVSGSMPEPLPPRCTLEAVEKRFLALVDKGDLVALRATLAAYAANMHLTGDPVWLGLVSGSSTGKTETAMALRRLPHVVVASTLSGEAALLSGTPAKDRAKGATGGLLGRVGDRGMLVLKDFTSIISMQRDRRGQILSAFREVFDGAWYRDIGGEGGIRLEWHGKLGMLMASTTAYDRAYAVIAELGDRFVLVRLADDGPQDGMRAALDGAGLEDKARDELADAVAGLLGHGPEHQALEATGSDKDRLAALADFVTQARSPVARDYRGEIELVLDREGPYRFGKQLYALWRAAGLLGLDSGQAWEIVARVARDSLPKLRWRVLAALIKGGGELSTNQVAQAVWHPKQSTKRTLEDLVAHRVVARRTVGKEDRWRLTNNVGEAVGAILEATPETPLDAIEPEMSPPPPEEDPTLPLESEQ